MIHNPTIRFFQEVIMSELLDEINACCKKLRLRRLTDHFSTISADDPQQFLLELLQKEVAQREKLRIERAIKNAGFYSHKDFDSFQL